MAKMKCLVFKLVGFHLNSEVIHTETIVKLGAQLPQQIGLRDAFRVNHVCAQRLSPGRDGSNVKVVDVGNSSSV